MIINRHNPLRPTSVGMALIYTGPTSGHAGQPELVVSLAGDTKHFDSMIMVHS